MISNSILTRANHRGHRVSQGLASRFEAQRLYGINRGGFACGIERRKYRDRAQQTAGQQARAPRGQQSGEEVWHGQQIHQETKSEGDAQSHAAAETRNQQRFEEKLFEDGLCGCAQGLAHTDFASALAHRHHHDVHDSEATEKKSDHAYRSEEILHTVGHLAEGLGLLHSVPDGTSFFVVGIEIVHLSQCDADFPFASLVLLVGLGRDQQLVKSGRSAWRFVWEVAAHGAEGNENLVHVEAVVTGILFFLLHHSDYGVGEIVQINVFAHGIAAREELFGGVTAEESDATAFAIVIPIIETTLADAEAADVLKRRQGARHQKSSIVVVAVGTDIILIQLGDSVLAVGSLGPNRGHVGVLPVHGAAGSSSAGLQAGTAVENDHDVFAQGL